MEKRANIRVDFSTKPGWLLPLNQPSDTKTVNDRTYHWCTKCNRGNRQWVLAHTTDTHREDFVLSYRKTDSDKKLVETKDLTSALVKGTLGSKFGKVHFNLQNQEKATIPPPTQCSLADGLSNCFHFDVQTSKMKSSLYQPTHTYVHVRTSTTLTHTLSTITIVT